MSEWDKCELAQQPWLNVAGANVTRARNVFRDANIFTIQQLCEFGEKRLLREPNCGRKVIALIANNLELLPEGKKLLFSRGVSRGIDAFTTRELLEELTRRLGH